jgi:hypothetical protein
LTNEEDLQALDTKELDELRPEFVEQMLLLRKKIIGKIKPKMMNGKKLNGQMMFELLDCYKEAINRGAVPNIQQAWSYIC